MIYLTITNVQVSNGSLRNKEGRGVLTVETIGGGVGVCKDGHKCYCESPVQTCTHGSLIRVRYGTGEQDKRKVTLERDTSRSKDVTSPRTFVTPSPGSITS